jgi:hypothetical protein
VPAAPALRPEEEGETSRERMRARTQLLTAISNRRKAIGEGADQATVKRLNEAVGEASRNARAAGYTPNAIARIISTPSDVSMFSRLPEVDQRAILRQADDKEFERYVTHAHMKIRAPMREERRSNQVDVTMPAVRRFPAPSSSASAPPPPSMPPCAAMIATSWCSALPSRRTPRRLAIDLEGGRVGEVKKGEMNQDPN